jgi:D-alanyl-D-alanine carboxypeptidase/D-alanyl-D-alanine-endopeptidase (penicillin-binding protein 4)
MEKRFAENGRKVFLPFISVIFLTFSFLGCDTNQRSEQADSSQETVENEFDIPKPNINLAEPLEISKRPEDLSLCQNIRETIEKSEFANARWGIIAISLSDARVTCGIDAQKLFNPASIQKVLTSIVALDKLGSDFRWRTSIFSKSEIENGTLNGDLTLYGRGAPDFDDQGVENLVAQLKAKGVRQIKGDIIGDDSFFKGEALGDGWAWNEIQWYYGAQASALTINKNQAKITLQNGKPRSSTGFVEVSGETKPVEDTEAVGVKRELGHNKVYVWGNGNNLDARIAVDNSALWSAEILKKELEKNGIKVEGKARFTDWKSDDKLNINSVKEFAFIESLPLKEIVRRMNKDSVNLNAELILRTLGKEFGEAAPDENPKMQKLRGDDSAGAAVVKKWLLDNNIAASELAIHDGSGLSRLDFVTPEAIGRALVFAAQTKFTDDFKKSLPIAGVDGTLRGRLGKLSNKIIAKTGSIQYVNSLAGFGNSKEETFAFVIICNNATGTADSSAVIDSVAASMINNSPQ